jgi:hypothetical protein
MVGDTLSSIPDHPLPPDTITELAVNDHIIAALPLVPRGVVAIDTVEWLTLQTTATGVLLGHVPRRGWIVRAKVGENASLGEPVTSALVELVLEWQRKRDGLWTALRNGGRRDLCDLIGDA